MKNHFLNHLVICALGLASGACVSVNLPNSAGSPAKNVEFSEPSTPFNEIKIKTTDKAWLSGKTGNTMSYYSDCNASTDPSLKQMETESINVLNKLDILNSKQYDFNGREALETIAQGEVDGVAVKTQLLVFKKNSCNYTITYGGLTQNFDLEVKFLQKFLESFRAP